MHKPVTEKRPVAASPFIPQTLKADLCFCVEPTKYLSHHHVPYTVPYTTAWHVPPQKCNYMSQLPTRQLLWLVVLVHSCKKSAAVASNWTTEGQGRNSGCSALYKALQSSEIMEVRKKMMEFSLASLHRAWLLLMASCYSLTLKRLTISD